MLKLSRESVEGLKKLKSDIITLTKKGNHSERTGTISRFGFIDIVKICVGIIVVVATIKSVVWILSW